MHVRAVLLLAVFIASAVTDRANACAPAVQEPTGTIRGVVLNNVGTALSAITIEATGASGVAYRTLTDRDGAFVLEGVPPDVYTLVAQGAAVKRAAIEQVRVSAGRSVRVDFTLARNAVADESRAIHLPGLVASALDDTAVFPADVIDRLPKARDVLSMAPMAPGMSADTVYTGLAFRGASAPENRYFIDGLDVTNMFSGGAAFSLPADLVQELEVGAGGAHFGSPTATGGIVNILTPFGGSRWRGSGGFHFTTDGLTSRLPSHDSRDPFTMAEPVLTAGGPLVGDWLSLFATYAPQFVSTSRTLAVTTASGNVSSARFVSANHTHLSADNIAGRFATSGRFRVSAIFGRARRAGTLPPNTASPVVNGFNWEGLVRSQPFGAFSAAFNLAPSNRYTVSAHAGYSRTDVLDYGVPDIVYRTGNAPDATTPPNVASALNAVRGESAAVPTNAGFDRDVQQRITAGASLGFRLRGLGEHDFKVGGHLETLANDVLAGSFGPVIVVNAVSGVPPYGTYQASSWLLSGKANTLGFAALAEDNWRLTPRLTLRLGARSERVGIPTYVASLPDASSTGIKTVRTPRITFGFGDTLAPRIGGAFDVAGDGRWLASASWSVTKDPVKLDLARHYLGADVRYQATYSLTTLDFTRLGVANCLNPDQCKILYPGDLLSTAPIFAVRTSRSHLKPTTGRDLLVALDHAIGASSTAGVRYIRKRLVRAFEDVTTLTATDAASPYPTLVTLGDAGVPLLAGTREIPPPRREYDAVEAEYSRRFRRGWQLRAAYTFSRLRGNYTAFFVPAAPGAVALYEPLFEAPWSYTAAYSTPFAPFDRKGVPVYGRLELDRPHVVRVQLLADLPLRLQVGAYALLASGMPISRIVSVAGQPVYYDGRLTDGRTPAYSQTDVRLQRQFRVSPRVSLRMGVDVLNLFGQQGTVAVNTIQAVLPPMSPSQALSGFDAGSLISSVGENPLFLRPSVWQPARQVRFDARLAF